VARKINVCLNHQASHLVGNAHRGAGTGAELKKVAFNPVTEDDAVLGHLGDKHQRLFGGDAAKDQGRLGGFARKRLTHREAKVVGIPGKSTAGGKDCPVSFLFGIDVGLRNNSS
jgi:hypothetical protein